LYNQIINPNHQHVRVYTNTKYILDDNQLMIIPLLVMILITSSDEELSPIIPIAILAAIMEEDDVAYKNQQEYWHNRLQMQC
jgi:hypothetical protein